MPVNATKSTNSKPPCENKKNLIAERLKPAKAMKKTVNLMG